MRGRRQVSPRLADALILIGMLGTAMGVVMLDDLVETMRGRTDVIAVLDDAEGVRSGTPIWIAGKPAGRVKQIEFLPRRPGAAARIAVTLEIVGRDFDQVRASSTVRLASDGLVGGTIVDIVPAAGTGPPLAENDTLYGVRRVGSVDALKSGAASLKASLDSLTGAAAVLAEPARRFARRADHVQRNLGSVQAELAAVQQQLRPGGDGAVLLDSAFHARLDRLTATVGAVGVAFRQARSRYAGVSAELVEPIARVQRRADTLSARITDFRSLLNAPAVPGAPARLRADSAAFLAIRGVRLELDSLIAEIRRDPFRFAF